MSLGAVQERRRWRAAVNPTSVKVALRSEPARVAWRAFWTSRLLVFFTGVFTLLSFPKADWAPRFDPASLTAPFGYFGNLLVSPFARWDSVWYLAISIGGYDHEAARTAFFPLYPMVIRAFGRIGGSWATYLVAGIVISMICFAIALALLYRLVELELGQDVARTTVMLTAFCPMAFYFSAVYSESLFLTLSLGCILCARRGRWLLAGVLGALAAATRNSGVVLVVPLVLMYLYGPRTDREPARPAAALLRGGAARLRRLIPRYRLRPGLLWILLVPVGLGIYILVLQLSMGDGLTPFQSQTVWFRHFAGPFGGIWNGTVAAWDGLRQLIHGEPPPIYFPQAGGDPFVAAGHNLVLFGFLVLGLAGLIGALRRLPIAYGAYALAALALPLSYPADPQPLMSLPRHELVLFPLFMWGGWWITKRRWSTPAIAGMAILLGLFTAEFASWRFVA
jgi:hypothetical protein